ncbi:SMP-30/gluconolactonase/LRE family protein [Pollutibacter soli]|uniref:SMP-30/gluconolactonase/LRE family protein n=1 Tax=Pollutibacter soli TaxID=3034157 RepID=UPI0030138B9A
METVAMKNISIPEIRILAEDLKFPEGPAFAPDGSLWLVEMKGESLVNFRQGKIERFHVGGAPNGIAIDASGMILYCDSFFGEVRMFNPITKEVSVLINQVKGEPLNKPNDLVFDKAGNLVFTCPGESRKEPGGYACVLMKDGTVKKITTGKYFPNGIAFTANGKYLIMAETYKHRLWKGRWDDESGFWSEEEPWCTIGGPEGPGGPDGMAFDEEGNLYVAVYGTGSVRVADIDGNVFRHIHLPSLNPTNCAFDTRGDLGLVVTEAGEGKLYSIDTGKKGQMLFAK